MRSLQNRGLLRYHNWDSIVCAMKTPTTKRSPVSPKKSKTKASQGRPIPESPRGRQEIVEAILRAAEKLLPKHNPADISLRQIADAANVNYSLIHRYFGTKESVITIAHERILQKVRAEFSPIDQIDGNVAALFKISGKNVSRRSLLARAMLNGADPRLIRHHFPIMQDLVDLLRKKKTGTKCPSEHDPELLAAFFAGSTLGWFFFEPFLLASTGLDKKDKEEIHREIAEMLKKTADLLC